MNDTEFAPLEPSTEDAAAVGDQTEQDSLDRIIDSDFVDTDPNDPNALMAE